MYKKHFALATVLLLLVLLVSVGCSDSDLKLQFIERSLAVGDTVYLKVGIDDKTEITFTNNNPDVVSISSVFGTSTLKIIAKKSGSAIVAITQSGKSAECTIAVSEFWLDSGIDEPTLSLTLSEKTSYKIQASTNSVEDLPIKYEIENEAIANVSQQGEVTPLSAGTTFLNISARTTKLTYTLIVTQSPLSINVNELYLVPQESYMLIASKNDGTPSWLSSDNSIVSVDEGGVVTAHRTGTAVITASSDNHTVDCTVYVIDTKISTLTNIQGTEPYVSSYGRNYPSPQGYIINNTAAGLGLKFYGTSLTISLLSVGDEKPGINISIDENPNIAEVTYLQPGASVQDIVIADNLPLSVHTVRILKVTESRLNSIAVVKATTDGHFAFSQTPSQRRIEVYGDSISAGLANIKEKGQPDNGKATNGLMTYATYAARDLDAEISVMAYSGLGLYNTYGDYNFVASKIYDRYYFGAKSFISEPPKTRWQFGNYLPQVIIINLGTNDVWSSNFNRAELLRNYKQFIDNLTLVYNDDVRIILVYGMMTAEINDLVSDIADDYAHVSAIAMPLRANQHPSYQEHRTAALLLTKHLKDIMNW